MNGREGGRRAFVSEWEGRRGGGELGRVFV